MGIVQPPSSEGDYLADIARRVAASWPGDLPRQPAYPFGRRPITEYLRGWARARPCDRAIVFYGRDITFEELDRWSDGLAGWLAGAGVGPGDRVAIFLPSCPQFSVAFLGILKAGAIVVPISVMAKAFEVAHYLNDARPALVIAQDSLVPVLHECGIEASRLIVTSPGALLPEAPTLEPPPELLAPPSPVDGAADLLTIVETDAPPAPAPDWDDIAVINYTGGTTGLPKGCMHAHGDLVYTGACGATFAYPNAGVVLNFLPMFWIAGEVSALLIPLVAGASLVLLSRWRAESVMAAIDRYRVTSLSLVVDNAMEIVEHPSVAEYDLTSLRDTHGFSFIQVLNPDHRTRWKAVTGGALLRESSFGMTETNACDTVTLGFQDDNFDLKRPATFVGLPMPGTEFKIVDDRTGALLPLGQEGDLYVRTPSLLKGYWKNAEPDRSALSEGWLNTGDTAIIDEEGFLTFRGRKREMLKVNGMSVFPAEVEALLMHHGAIVACGVTGRSDPAKGQRPVAFVKLRPDSDETVGSLTAWCRSNMAVYKVPEIRVVADLPMTATGKVKRAELSALL